MLTLDPSPWNSGILEALREEPEAEPCESRLRLTSDLSPSAARTERSRGAGLLVTFAGSSARAARPSTLGGCSRNQRDRSNVWPIFRPFPWLSLLAIRAVPDSYLGFVVCRSHLICPRWKSPMEQYGNLVHSCVGQFQTLGLTFDLSQQTERESLPRNGSFRRRRKPDWRTVFPPGKRGLEQRF